MNKRYALQKLIKEQQVIGHPGIKQATFRALAKSFLNHLTSLPLNKAACFDSYTNICTAIGCSEPTLTKIIGYWSGEGILTWEKGWRNKEQTMASVYQFNEADMQERLKTQQAWFDAQKAARIAAKEAKKAEVADEPMAFGCQPSEQSEQQKSEVADERMAFICQSAQPTEDTELNSKVEKTRTECAKKVADEPMALCTHTYGTGVRIRTTQSIRTNTETNESSFSEDQNTPQANPARALMSTPTLENTARLQKPRMTLEQAGRILKAFDSSAVLNFVCADCLSSDTAKDGHCTRDDMGSACGSTRLVSRATRFDWFKELQAQWQTYQRQRDAEQKVSMAALGVTLKDIVGRLDLPSMEKQPEIVKCCEKADTKSVAERRKFAKEPTTLAS